MTSPFLDAAHLPIPDFSTKVHAKWLLAGEHAVLRRSPALAFPLQTHGLGLNYYAVPPTPKNSQHLLGQPPERLADLFNQVLTLGLEMTHRSMEHVHGAFQLQSRVALGGGLGASATLCAAVAKWFVFQQWVSEREMPEFARQLENFFHRESSGVDIAAVLHPHPIHYRRHPYTVTPVTTTWQPNWYLSYTQQQVSTAQCVSQVNALFDTDPDQARAIDTQMEICVDEAFEWLTTQTVDDTRSYEGLAKVIQKAQNCFEAWGLVPTHVARYLEVLLEAGALAAKLTGAGGGGHVLSLWPKGVEPPSTLGLLQIVQGESH